MRLAKETDLLIDWGFEDTNPPCRKAAVPAPPTMRTPSPTVNIFSDVSPPPPAPAVAPAIFTDAPQPSKTPSRTPSKLSIFSDAAPTPAKAPTPPPVEPVKVASPQPIVPPTPVTEPPPSVKARRPSPTINTKAALSDVMGFFNAGADDEEDGSDSSSSDDEDEDEEEPIMMVYEDGSAVPPTPTPASARNQVFALKKPQGAPSVLAGTAIQEDEDVFIEEKSVAPVEDSSETVVEAPSPATTPMIFRDENDPVGRPTPSKTPARTPLSSRKPTFGVLADTREAEEPLPQQPAFNPPQDQNQNQNVFSTPLPSRQPFRRPAALASFSEDAEPEEQDLQATEYERLEELREDAEDEASYRSQRGTWDGRVGGFELMTPITERTCEFTTDGRKSFGTRSSIAPTDFGIAEEEEEEDNTDADQAFHTATTNLRSVSQSPSIDSTRGTPSVFGDNTGRSTVDTEFDRSGSTPFALSEGHTIEGNTGRTEGLMDTMQIVDGTNSLRLDEDAPVDPSQATSKLAVPNPCNPQDEDIVKLVLAAVDPPASSVPGFKDHSSTPIGRLDGFQKAAKARQRRGSTGSNKSNRSGKTSLDTSPFGTIDLDGREFEVREKIGEGGFGAVFLARDVASYEAALKDDDADDDLEDEDDESDDEGEAKHLVALKVETPSSVWEGVVLSRVHDRLPQELGRSIIAARGLYVFKDESYLVLDYSPQGTLLDAVNHASRIGIASSAQGAQGMDELVVMFFAVELLKVVEALHRASFVHGDLKIDNCLVRLDSVDNASWNAQYSAEGQGGWASKGVKVIDFGRAIDMSLYRGGQTFIADWPVDQRDCAEMREARPWSYQADYHGLASVFYCMLFGMSFLSPTFIFSLHCVSCSLILNSLRAQASTLRPHSSLPKRATRPSATR